MNCNKHPIIGHDMQIIYLEKSLQHHHRALRILDRFKKKRVIMIEHYGEVFNRKQQNFRLQKQKPALILAEKKGKKVLPTPPSFGIGGVHNYYFSHLLNCPFDCEYCFLQGMYQSAHHVLFINFEDFMQEIIQTCNKHREPSFFFSGYDGDSLALEPVSGFLQDFLPFFNKLDNAYLELRTKSANVKALLKHPPMDNCIVAFSLTPEAIAASIEHKTASTTKRLHAMGKIAKHGYPVGIRLDPLIYASDFEQHYHNLINAIATTVPASSIHSISLGAMRFPQKMYDRIQQQHPHSPLLNHPLVKHNKQVSYSTEMEHQMSSFIRSTLKTALPKATIFSCHA